MSSKIRVAIVGVGNCASSFVQGVEYYRDVPWRRPDPRAHAQRARWLRRRRHRVRVRLRRGRGTRSGATSARRSSASRTTRCGSPTSRSSALRCSVGPRSTVSASSTAKAITESDAEPVDVAAALRASTTWTSSSATCRSAPSSRPATTSSRRSRPASPSSTASRSSSHPTPSGSGSSRKPDSRSSATTSSRRSARRSSTASSRSSSRTAASPSTTPTSSTSAATWTSRTCSSAAGSRPRSSRRRTPCASQRHAGDRGPRRPHRTVGPRPVARRPQVGVHPPRGSRLRWSADVRRAQARGLGLAELRGRRRRRGPVLQARDWTAGIGGSLAGPSAYFMKSPAVQYPDDVARQMTEDFIETESREPVPD